jgi:hypothetical protein
MPSFIKNLTFDCVDALRVARFWAATLGSDVDEDSTAQRAYLEAAAWGVQTSGSGGIAVRRRRRTAFTWIFEPRPRCVTRWNAWSTSALSWSTGTTTLRSCSIRKATSSASSSDRVRVPRLIERPWQLAPSTVVAAGFSDVDIRRVPRSTAHTSARLERSGPASGRSRVPVP